MIANTRKMHEMQQKLRKILLDDYFIYDLFDSIVIKGEMTEEKLKEMATAAKRPEVHTDEIVRLTKEEIMANPYLSNIKIPNITLNNFTLGQKRFIRPNTVSTLGFKTIDINTMHQTKNYYICNKALRFPGLIEGDNTACWMSVEPSEIESFKSFIEEATGNVLLIGCGLGYVAYMLSRKEAVSSVTIVDNNQNVLDLFTTHILPQFEHKEKIQTVKEDGLSYLKTRDLSVFDHINADIWYDTIDMIYPYLRCLEIERENPNVKFSYWLEEEIKFNIQKSILIAACREDSVEGKENTQIQEDTLIKAYSEAYLLANKIGRDIVRENKIERYEDLQRLVDIKDLRGLLLTWYADNLDVVEMQESTDMAISNSFHSNSKPYQKGLSNLGNRIPKGLNQGK